MEKQRYNFSDLVVSSELIELRDRAGDGQIPAMLELADRLFEGDGAGRNVQVMDRLSSALLNHPQGPDCHHTLSRIMMISIKCFELQWQAGIYEDDVYIEAVRQMMVHIVQLQTVGDAENWDLTLLQTCINWLAAEQSQREADPEPV
jgi:hypothetical protein